MTLIFAIPIGVLAAVKQYSLDGQDRSPSSPRSATRSPPSCSASLLLSLRRAGSCDLFPLFGRETLGKEGDILDLAWHLVLPVLTLAIVGVAG